MKLYFITGNKGKFEEAKVILFDLNIEQCDIDLPEIQEIDQKKVIEKKLQEALNQVDGACMVEDGGLYFDGLQGLPGILIKWFSKTIGNDGLWKFAKAFNVSGAEARVTIGYAKDKNEIYYFEGVIRGSIVEPRGTFGFGWDPIFLPDGQDKTFGEMTMEEKNKMSMRKIALNKLRDFLGKQKKV